VGVSYTPESPEWEMPDQLAAYQLGLHALARDVQRLHAELGTACPREVENLAASAMWMRGM